MSDCADRESDHCGPDLRVVVRRPEKMAGQGMKRCINSKWAKRESQSLPVAVAVGKTGVVAFRGQRDHQRASHRRFALPCVALRSVAWRRHAAIYPIAIENILRHESVRKVCMKEILSPSPTLVSVRISPAEEVKHRLEGNCCRGFVDSLESVSLPRECHGCRILWRIWGL